MILNVIGHANHLFTSAAFWRISHRHDVSCLELLNPLGLFCGLGAQPVILVTHGLPVRLPMWSWWVAIYGILRPSRTVANLIQSPAFRKCVQMRIFSGSLPLATTNTLPTFPAAMPLYLSFKLITSRIRLTEDWEDPQIFVRHVFPPNFPTEPCWVAKKRNLTEYQPVIIFVLTYETGLQKWWLLWYNCLKPRPTVQRTPGYASRCKASNYLGCCVNISY